LVLPGIQELLFSSEESNNTDFPIGNDNQIPATASELATILAQAQVHQAEASNYQIGQTVKTVGGTGMGTTSMQTNLFRAQQVQAQHQQKQNQSS
jgi:hypothetical protein